MMRMDKINDNDTLCTYGDRRGTKIQLTAQHPQKSSRVNGAAFHPVVDQPIGPARPAAISTGAPLFASPVAPLQSSYTARPFRRGVNGHILLRVSPRRIETP